MDKWTRQVILPSILKIVKLISTLGKIDIPPQGHKWTDTIKDNSNDK